MSICHLTEIFTCMYEKEWKYQSWCAGCLPVLWEFLILTLADHIKSSVTYSLQLQLFDKANPPLLSKTDNPTTSLIVDECAKVWKQVNLQVLHKLSTPCLFIPCRIAGGLSLSQVVPCLDERLGTPWKNCWSITGLTHTFLKSELTKVPVWTLQMPQFKTQEHCFDKHWTEVCFAIIVIILAVFWFKTPDVSHCNYMDVSM